MSKKKMCPNYMSIKEGGHLWCKGSGRIQNCPKNTDARCEIIPAKKTVTVKGWCTILIGPSGHTWVKADNMVSNAGKRINCTITYKIKKEAKK